MRVHSFLSNTNKKIRRIDTSHVNIPFQQQPIVVIIISDRGWKCRGEFPTCFSSVITRPSHLIEWNIFYLFFAPPGRAGGEVGWGVPLDGGEEDDQLQPWGGRRLAHKVQKCAHHILQFQRYDVNVLSISPAKKFCLRVFEIIFNLKNCKRNQIQLGSCYVCTLALATKIPRERASNLKLVKD